ncbi:MAG: glycosyltransferase [Actinobacteria bacterium]|nr:glycosyltransferase [Actinomycetota bacterium]
MEVTYCVVNTQQRELLVRCLDTLARERAELPFATEVLVLDNASTDGSAGAARRHATVDDLVTRDRRMSKPANDNELLQRARGRYALLLNEDSELLPGATLALHGALEADPDAGAAGARLLRPDRRPQPSAWRFPGPGSALAAALNLHRRLVVQSRGEETRRVHWAQSAALLVRVEHAREIGWLDTQFFVYSDEVDFCKRLADAGHHTLYVPGAQAIHHEQLSTGTVPERRIVELSRNRDRYMRKHHSALSAAIVRWLTAWTYAVRALFATVVPGHDAARYRRHVRATLRPDEGEGLREAAADFNLGPRL